MKAYIHTHFNAFDDQLDPMLASFVAIEQQQRIALRKQQKKHKRNLQYLSLFLLMSIMCFVYQLYHALTSESLSAFSPMIKVPAIYQLSPNGQEPSALKQQSDLKSQQAQLSTSLKQSQSQSQALGQGQGQGQGHSQAVGQGQALAQGRAHEQDKVHGQGYEQGQVQGKSQAYDEAYAQALAQALGEALATAIIQEQAKLNDEQAQAPAQAQAQAQAPAQAQAHALAPNCDGLDQHANDQYKRHFAPVIEPEAPSALYDWFLPEQALLLSKSLDEDGIRSLTNLLEGLKQGNPYFEHHDFSNGEQWAYQGELLIKTPLRNPVVRKVKNNNGLEPLMQPYPYQDFKDWQDILAMVAAVQKDIHMPPYQPLTGQPDGANH